MFTVVCVGGQNYRLVPVQTVNAWGCWLINDVPHVLVPIEETQSITEHEVKVTAVMISDEKEGDNDTKHS